MSTIFTPTVSKVDSYVEDDGTKIVDVRLSGPSYEYPTWKDLGEEEARFLLSPEQTEVLIQKLQSSVEDLKHHLQ